jgi:hypothetical protein
VQILQQIGCPGNRLVIGYGDRRFWSEAMPGRKPKALKLKAKDVIELRALLRDGHTPQRVAQRARILLAFAHHERSQAVADKVDQNRTTIWRVCDRYRQEGLQAALQDAPRSGRPRVFFQGRTAGD